MEKIKLFEAFVTDLNEGAKDVADIAAKLAEVTKKMKEMVKGKKKEEIQGDSKLMGELKGLTATKKKLQGELDSAKENI